MLNDFMLIQLTLDDGQVINDKLINLTRSQIISVANQYHRIRCISTADELMRYQHKKFSTNSPYKD